MKDLARIARLNALITAAPGTKETDRLKWVANTLKVQRRSIYVWRCERTGSEVGQRSLDILADAVAAATGAMV